MNQDKITGDWIMTFGKYDGCQLSSIPSSYLLWAYENIRTLRPDLKQYIEGNMEDLKKEVKNAKK